jgi:hypothetical protein
VSSAAAASIMPGPPTAAAVAIASFALCASGEEAWRCGCGRVAGEVC